MSTYGDYGNKFASTTPKETAPLQNTDKTDKNKSNGESVNVEKINSISKLIFSETKEKKLEETATKKWVSSKNEDQEINTAKIDSISKPIFVEDKKENLKEKTSPLADLEDSYEKNAKKIALLIERIEEMKASGAEENKDKIIAFEKMRDKFEQAQENLKIKIEEQKKDDQIISTGSVIINEENEYEMQQEKIEMEQAKIEVEQGEIDSEQTAIMEENLAAGDLQEAEAVNLRQELERNSLKNIYTVIRNRLDSTIQLEQLQKPNTPQEAKQVKKIIDNEHIIYFKNGTLKVPEELRHEFKPGSTIPIKHADGSISIETIQRVEIFTKKELTQFKQDFNHLILAPLISQQPTRTSDSKPSSETEEYQPPPSDKTETSSTSEEVDKKTDKNLEKTFVLEGLKIEKSRADLARLEKNREKIQEKVKILKKFIKKWIENDENLKYDLKNQSILQDFVSKYKIKIDSVQLEEVTSLCDEELEFLGKELSKTNRKIEKIKITLEKPRNLKRSIS